MSVPVGEEASPSAQASDKTTRPAVPPAPGPSDDTIEDAGGEVPLARPPRAARTRPARKSLPKKSLPRRQAPRGDLGDTRGPARPPAASVRPKRQPGQLHRYGWLQRVAGPQRPSGPQWPTPDARRETPNLIMGPCLTVLTCYPFSVASQLCEAEAAVSSLPSAVCRPWSSQVQEPVLGHFTA